MTREALEDYAGRILAGPNAWHLSDLVGSGDARDRDHVRDIVLAEMTALARDVERWPASSAEAKRGFAMTAVEMRSPLVVDAVFRRVVRGLRSS